MLGFWAVVMLRFLNVKLYDRYHIVYNKV